MVIRSDNGQQLNGSDNVDGFDPNVLQNLEMALYQASCQVGALAFLRLKQQAAALLAAGMDPRRFEIQIANQPPAVQIAVKGNIVKATSKAPVPENLRFDPNA